MIINFVDEYDVLYSIESNTAPDLSDSLIIYGEEYHIKKREWNLETSTINVYVGLGSARKQKTAESSSKDNTSQILSVLSRKQAATDEKQKLSENKLNNLSKQIKQFSTKPS